MTVGEFREGIPIVILSVYAPRLGLTLGVPFVIDTGTPRTVVSLADIGRPDEVLPQDDVVAVDEVHGISFAIVGGVLLGFSDEPATPRLFGVDALIVNKPRGSSRLGRDVLNRLQLVYNEREGLLLLSPLDE